MKSLSVKLVLVTVLLQLCLSVLEVNAGGGAGARPAAAGGAVPNFGDLIEFPRAGLYSHYGIYVGGMNLDGQGQNENIFEMTSDGCKFSTYAGPFTIRNDIYPDPPQNENGMRATIEALMRDTVRCKEYSLRKENCEMVATLVRYGVAMCKQKGTAAAGVAKKLNPRKKRQKNKQEHHEASAAA